MHLQLDQIIASTIRTTWLVARSRAGISLHGDRNYACGAGDRDGCMEKALWKLMFFFSTIV